ncbi:hypothetical protein PENSPDRAFT_549960, partial [Peniophora sp. CONT]
MVMALPAGIPTLQLSRTRQWHRPDNVWCSRSLEGTITTCDTDPANRGPKTDHVPILTTLDIPLAKRPPEPKRNIRMTNWDAYREQLAAKLRHHSPPQAISTQDALDTVITNITVAVQETTDLQVPFTKERSGLKPWWTSDLTVMRKAYQQVDKEAYRWRGTPNHPAHLERYLLRRAYARAIRYAKKVHWEEWLNKVCEDDVWKANKYASSKGSD